MINNSETEGIKTLQKGGKNEVMNKEKNGAFGGRIEKLSGLLTAVLKILAANFKAPVTKYLV